MFDEINKQLEEAQQGVIRIKQIDSKLTELNKRKDELDTKEIELKRILEKEDSDVTKLEEKNLAHFLYTVMGNMDKKLQKEQQEAVAAKLKYDQVVSELEVIKDEKIKLQIERRQYSSSQKAYDELYAKKKEMILQSHSATAQRIMDLEEEISRNECMMKEIQEAVRAGNTVMSYVNDTLNSLDKAEGWGTMDLLGGGFLSDMIKHSNIDDAKQGAEQTQMALLRFRTELADVKINSSISIDTDGFGKFADFFFDGLIADWSMQSRIHDSQASADEVRSQVHSVLQKLSRMESELNNRNLSLIGEYNTLIEYT